MPAPTPPELIATLKWAERNLIALVTEDDGTGAFIRGTGIELAGFGHGMEQLRATLRDLAVPAPAARPQEEPMSGRMSAIHDAEQILEFINSQPKIQAAPAPAISGVDDQDTWTCGGATARSPRIPCVARVPRNLYPRGRRSRIG